MCPLRLMLLAGVGLSLFAQAALQQHARLHPLRIHLRPESPGSRRAPQPLRGCQPLRRISLPALPHLQAARLLGWRPAPGHPLHAHRSRRMALARQQQYTALGGPERLLHLRGIRCARIRARRQPASLGLDRGTRPPTAPLDGRHAVPLRFPRPGAVPAHRGHPRRAEVQPHARPGAGHARTSRAHLPLARPPQRGAFPAPRPMRSAT